MTAKWVRLGWPAGTSALVHDVWAHKDLGTVKDEYTVEVPSHGVAMIKATPQNLPAGNLAPTISLISEHPTPAGRRGKAAPATPPNQDSFVIRALPYGGGGRVAKVEILEGEKVLKSFQGGRYTVDLRRPAGQYVFSARRPTTRARPPAASR